GLEVDALDGAPGVYSARYAGEEKNPDKNMDQLLSSMKGVSNRNAQFRTVIVLANGNQEKIFEGIVRGKILEEKRGTSGFGYDPVFQPEGHTKTFAEMSPEEKNSISHRAIATGKLLAFLTGQAERKIAG
ncbi:MAG TPA: non-canonical purine NTP pyrophosphatase, partial [Bacteroidia bacterium]|nr:non-canonical purine NTP pyrophosphatase [Bacteroidia bacterium]